MNASSTMIFDGGTWWLVGFLATGLIGAVTYLVKRTLFSRIDDLTRIVRDMQAGIVRKYDYMKDLDRLRVEIEQIRKDYTPKDAHEKAFDEVRSDIKRITENYLTKEDFFREQAKTDRKLDQIISMLVKKGED